MFDVLITPASATLEFTSSNGASIQLVASESQAGVIALNFIASSGSLFSLIDSFTGSLGSISDASGLPIFEVFSDNRVIMGEFGQNDLHMSGNMVGIGVQPTAKLHVSGGGFFHDGDELGFYTTTPISKPEVTGSRGGNVALEGLLNAMSALGLITDNSS